MSPWAQESNAGLLDCHNPVIPAAHKVGPICLAVARPLMVTGAMDLNEVPGCDKANDPDMIICCNSSLDDISVDLGVSSGHTLLW